MLTLFLLACCEGALRLVPPEHLLFREKTSSGQHTDTAQPAVLAMIDIRGSADVALVGSSMMREAVNVPRMAYTLRKLAHRKISVGSYAVRGARAEEIAGITHELLNSKRRPKTLIIGLSLRDLQTDHRRLSAVSEYWQLSDWLTQFQSAIQSPNSKILPLLPTAVDNTFARHLRLVRFRTTLADLLFHPHLEPSNTNPITGDPGHNFRSYVADGKVTVRAIRKQLNKEYKTDDLTPDAPAVAALSDAVAEIQSRSPATRIILFELPIPAVTRKALPKSQYNQFLTLTQSIAQSHHIRFLTASDLLALHFKPKDGYFLDSQHMNTYGNTHFADTLATIVDHEPAR